jgi:hypothetical protein
MSGFEEAEAHSHSHDHEHDDHDHDHDHDHNSDDETKLPPIERVVRPGDIIELDDDMDSIYIVGTRSGKVTQIMGLENMAKLKVLIENDLLG